jgi:hypothetical protein
MSGGVKGHEVVQLMSQAAQEMAAEYERIRARSREDPGTAGDEGEENWAELLRRWLPATYHVVAKGRILYSDGQASPQVDVLVLSPAYPTGLLNKKTFGRGLTHRGGSRASPERPRLRFGSN